MKHYFWTLDFGLSELLFLVCKCKFIELPNGPGIKKYFSSHSASHIRMNQNYTKGSYFE